MNFIRSLIYGLVSGLTEFLPISSRAHQALLLQMFGMQQRSPLLDLLIHIAVLLSLLTASNTFISKIRRETRHYEQLRRSRRRGDESLAVLDMRIVKTACVPMLLGLVLLWATESVLFQSARLAFFFLLNGIILLIPEYMRHGNKDARAMSGFDSICLGIASACSVLPGLSRIGCGLSYTVARGADRQNAVNWVLLLSVPALALTCVYDFWSIFTVGVGTITFLIVLGYILAAAISFCFGYLSVLLLRFVSEKAGFAAFGYYCFGAALFTWILYLLT